MKPVVIEAIDEVMSDHPEWFDFNSPTGWVVVLRPGKYMDAVITAINNNPPYRADYQWYSPDSTISIKKTNDFSENYAILGGPNGVRKAYGGTCEPAEF